MQFHVCTTSKQRAVKTGFDTKSFVMVKINSSQW